MYGGHEYEFGTRQPLGEIVTGQRLLEQVAGQYSLPVNAMAIMEERKKFGQTSLAPGILHQYEGPGQLNIEKDDIVLIPKDLKKVTVGVVKESPFVAFNGSKKFDSAREYRMLYRFAGIALTPYAFNNDCQGKGITVQARGVANFINRSGKVLMPGDLLTWEPNLESFKDDVSPLPKRMKMAGYVALKARFTKYEPVPKANEAAIKTKLTEFGIPADNVPYHYSMLPLEEIVGRNAECTQPNQWGRIILA